MGAAIFALALLGILSRPQLDVASFWPANAVMLGLLVRFPHLARATSWLACAVGFFLADALTGSPLPANLILNSGNLLSVATGYALLMRLPEAERALKRPMSMVHFLRAILAASLVAGFVGALANPILFDGPQLEGLFFWSISELVNYAAILPVILTLPAAQVAPPAREAWFPGLRKRAAPLVTLVASIGGSIVIGGPGAIAFPIPALLWCALAYRLFTTACLALVYAASTLISIRLNVMHLGDGFDTREALTSARLAIALIALGPLVVASVMAARSDLLKRLRTLVDLDAMTGLRNRRAFFEHGGALLEVCAAQNRPVSVMMLDIDHFKTINDRHGHEMGDRVLITFAQILARTVRPDDVVGRVGGEEFAVVLPDCAAVEAMAVAARINSQFRSAAIDQADGAPVFATVSIGIHADPGPASLEQRLSQADKALYRAKNSGRDTIDLSQGAQ